MHILYNLFSAAKNILQYQMFFNLFPTLCPGYLCSPSNLSSSVNRQACFALLLWPLLLHLLLYRGLKFLHHGSCCWSERSAHNLLNFGASSSTSASTSTSISLLILSFFCFRFCFPCTALWGRRRIYRLAQLQRNALCNWHTNWRMRTRPEIGWSILPRSQQSLPPLPP